MRFPAQAAVEDLKALIAVCDDETAAHFVWIHRDGEVHITRVENREMLAEIYTHLFSRGAIYIFEGLACGGGWVGPAAAADSNWMPELHGHLREAWARYEWALSQDPPLQPRLEGLPNLFALLGHFEQKS